LVNKTATGCVWQAGDFYFFINDVWHGPRTKYEWTDRVKVMIGAFAAHDLFQTKSSRPMMRYWQASSDAAASCRFNTLR